MERGNVMLCLELGFHTETACEEHSVTVQALQKAADAELMCVCGWRVFMGAINKCMNPYKSSCIKVS